MDINNPINGTMRSAVSSGDIHLIENERLIELLFRWDDLVLDSYEEIEIRQKYSIDTYVPLLHKCIQMKEVYKK